MGNSKQQHIHDPIAQTSEQQVPPSIHQNSYKGNQFSHPMHRLQRAVGNQFTIAYLQQQTTVGEPQDDTQEQSSKTVSEPINPSNIGIKEEPKIQDKKQLNKSIPGKVESTTAIIPKEIKPETDEQSSKPKAEIKNIPQGQSHKQSPSNITAKSTPVINTEDRKSQPKELSQKSADEITKTAITKQEPKTQTDKQPSEPTDKTTKAADGINQKDPQLQGQEQPSKPSEKILPNSGKQTTQAPGLKAKDSQTSKTKNTNSEVKDTKTLRAWRASVARATDAIPPPNISQAAQGGTQIRQLGGGIRKRHKSDHNQLRKEAQKAVSPAPKTKDPPKVAPHPVPQAPKLVEAKSNRRLQNQTMPDLQTSPQGTVPQLGQRPTPPSAPKAPAPKPAVSKPGTTAADKTEGQKQLDKLRQRQKEKIADTQPQDKSKGITLEDKPPPPPKPLPSIAKEAVGAVLAQILAQPNAEAEKILKQAREAAYPGKKLQEIYPDIGNQELPGLTESLTTELDKVRQEAGIAKEQLAAKVEAQKNKLAKQKQQATSNIKETGKDEKKQLETTGQQKTADIQGVRQAVDQKTEAQLEAANGKGDPAVIRMRRDRLKREINQQVGQQRFFYEQAKKRREQQLDKAQYGQNLAYQAAAQKDEQRILAKSQKNDTSASLQTRKEVKKIRNWSEQQQRELKEKVFGLKVEARGWADGYKKEVQQAGRTATELIQSWSDKKLGEERSWWQKLWQLFQDWAGQAQAESEAWETARAGETKKAIITDFVVLNTFIAKAGKNVTDLSDKALKGLSEEQKAVIRAYYKKDGPAAGNHIAAVAAGIRTRLSFQRRPQLIKKFQIELKGKEDDEWTKLDLLGKAQQGGFSADHIQKELYQAMHGGVTGLGTDEERLFRALGGLTPVQAIAVRKCYRDSHGRDLDADIKSELDGAELTRAQAQLSGDRTLADVATLHEAMHGGLTGLGTDEDAIMRVLRGKSEEERLRIISLYKRKYNRELKADLKGELTSVFDKGNHDLDRANALLGGNTAKADAIAIDQAMRGGMFGWGTDESTIEGVYKKNREEVVAQGARQKPPWTTKQIEAEIARRNLSVENSYNAKYGGDWKQQDDSALRQAFKSEMSGPQLDLVNALADNNIIKADAARIAIEAQGIIYADDDVVNGVLEKQYNRAFEEIKRDEWTKIKKDYERKHKIQLDKIKDPYLRQSKERELLRILETKAKKRAKEYMTQLEDSYNSEYTKWGTEGSLRQVITSNMSGYDQKKAETLLEQGGYLSPAQQIHYAVEGVGTDEAAIKKALQGRSPEEIAEIRAKWAKLHPNEKLDDRIKSETSGRDQFDTEMLLKGEPRNIDEEMAQMKERADWELKNSSAGFLASEERKILEKRLESLNQQYQEIKNLDPKDPKRQRALEKFKQRSGNVSNSIEGYREQVDSVTDTAASAAGITAAIAVGVVATALTGGAASAATPAVMSALASKSIAGASAAAAIAATMTTKYVMKGKAYGWEDVGLDVAVGAVDIAASFATAGVGAGLLKAARGGSLAKMAGSPSRMARMFAHGLAEGAEGVISTLPSALTGNLLNDQNWEQGNPFTNIALGTMVETGIGTVMSAGLGSLGGISRPVQPDARLAKWRDYKAENPDATMRDFLRYEKAEKALKLKEGEAQHQLQRQLRGDLLSGIPPAQRGSLSRLPIEVLSEADFNKQTGGKSGATALITKKGRTRLVVKEGTNPAKLRDQGKKLSRSIVLDAAGNPVEVGRVLPADLRNRVPVDVDPDLPGNTVRVYYDIDPKTGLVTNIRMRVGIKATAVDIKLHTQTVRLMRRYAGFLGRVRNLMDRIASWTGRYGEPPLGSRAWEAKLEVEKLPRIIEERLARLSSRDFSLGKQTQLLNEIEDLWRQYKRHTHVLDHMESSSGQGFVAAEGLQEIGGKTKRLRQGSPDAKTLVRDIQDKLISNTQRNEFLEIVLNLKKNPKRSWREVVSILELHKDELFEGDFSTLKNPDTHLGSGSAGVNPEKRSTSTPTQLTGEPVPNSRLEATTDRLPQETPITHEAGETNTRLKTETLSKAETKATKFDSAEFLHRNKDFTQLKEKLVDLEEKLEQAQQALREEPSEIRSELNNVNKAIQRQIDNIQEILEDINPQQGTGYKKNQSIKEFQSHLQEILEDLEQQKDEYFSYLDPRGKPNKSVLAQKILESADNLIKQKNKLFELHPKDLDVSDNKGYKLRNATEEIIHSIKDQIERAKHLIKQLADTPSRLNSKLTQLSREIKEIQDQLNQKGEERWKIFSDNDGYDRLGGEIDPCFPPGTIVKTPVGDRPIESLKVGEYVLSYNFVTDEVVTCQIKNVLKNWTLHLVNLGLKGETILATRLHPFWVEKKEKWIAACELVLDMELRTIDNQSMPIKSLRTDFTFSETYNLSITDLNNYFVGELGILVHNVDKISSYNPRQPDFPKHRETYNFYRIYLKDKPEVTIYIGQVKVGEQRNVNVRFSEHLSRGSKGKDFRRPPSPGIREELGSLWKVGEPFHSHKEKLSVETIHSRECFPYEADIWELHLIERYRKDSNHQMQNDFSTPPIGDKKFNKFKDFEIDGAKFYFPCP